MSHGPEEQLPDAWFRTESSQLARAILDGQIGMLEGCVPLAFLAYSAVEDWTLDPDFAVIGAIAAEVEELPLGEARGQWSSAALARADEEIERTTERYRERILAACRNIVTRFPVDGAAPA
jgi:hypothetical protein